MTDTSFPNYLEMTSRVSLGVWRAIRVVSVAALVTICVAAVLVPTDTLTLFWGVLIPILPVVFLIAPGSWRNVCPLAALNQSSRNLGVSRAATAPRWLTEYGFVFASTAFIGIVIGRKVWFNHSGPGLAVLLGVVAVGALIGGWLLKGSRGRCAARPSASPSFG